MELSTLIGSSIALFIMITALFIYYSTKEKKEVLTIQVNGDKVKLLLTDDEYCSFDISGIKDDKERIYTEIKKVLEIKAKKLCNFVDSVKLYGVDNAVQQNELFQIIKNAK